jgi:cell division protein FtsQ
MESRKEKSPYLLFRYVIQVLKIILLCVIVLSCVFIGTQFRLSKYFPIKKVRVYGVNHINQKDVQEWLVPLVTHGFFNINVDHIRDRLLQQPWASDIFVRRNWPDQVEITIVEKNAVALWNNVTLLSEAGVLFAPEQGTYPTNLPLLVGPEGQQIVMLNYFNEINRILTPLRVKISYLELTSYLTWKLALDNGIILQIGHKDVLSRLGHFVKVYPKIVGNRAEDVYSIDLRYSNGVALRWKAPVKT